MSDITSLVPTCFQAPERPADYGPIRAGLLVAALFFGGFGTWAAWAPLSSAAVASGQVRVDGHRKTVQHLEGGIIRDILVRDGDAVQAGQVLARMDATQPDATRDLLQGQHNALQALEARLVAERDRLPTIRFPAHLEAQRSDLTMATILAGQETIFASRQRAMEGQMAILNQRIEQFRSEIDGKRAQVASAERQAVLIGDEINGIAALVAKGLERRPRLLALQREGARLEGILGEQAGLIAKAEQGIGEARMQMADLINTQANEIASELRDVQTKLADLEEKLRAASDVAERTEILAPHTGRVLHLRHFTPGGVVKPGEPILEVVPWDDKMVIEAKVRPLDIEAVHAGLPAEVRLSAYKSRSTPTVPGTVIHVSADSLVDDRSGESHYMADIEIAPEQLARLDGVRLAPGMPAEVMIVTGERTALQYLLLDPVRESFSRAWREK